MRTFCLAFTLFFSLFLLEKTAAQTSKTTPAKDSMNPKLEAILKTRLAAIDAEVLAMTKLLNDSSQTGYFTSSFNDSLNAVYYRLDNIFGLTNERIVWPIDSSLLKTTTDTTGWGGTKWPTDSFPMPPAPTMNKGFGFMTKKSKRTIFSWGISWGVADALGQFTNTGSAAQRASFDLEQSRHSRIALLLRTRLGKRDTVPDFGMFGSGGGGGMGGKFGMIKKMRDAKDQFRASKVNLKYGIVFDRVTLEQASDYSIELNGSNPEFLFESAIQQSKSNRLLVRYIELPFLAEFMITKSLKLEAGPFVGFRTRAQQVVEYTNSSFEFVRTRRDALGFRRYNYGAMVGFGFKSLFLDAKLDLSNLFVDNPNYDYKLLSLGFTFGL